MSFIIGLLKKNAFNPKHSPAMFARRRLIISADVFSPAVFDVLAEINSTSQDSALAHLHLVSML